MSQLALKDRLAAYFRRHHSEWISSGDIQRLASANTTYTPSNVSRRLRELENEGVLEVQYRKGHAWYRAKPTMDEWFDRLPVQEVANLGAPARATFGAARAGTSLNRQPQPIQGR